MQLLRPSAGDGGVLVLLGATGGTNEGRKGFSCLQSALIRLAAEWHGQAPITVVFGASVPARRMEIGVPVIYVGTGFRQ
jgi:hypothetical protein